MNSKGKPEKNRKKSEKLVKPVKLYKIEEPKSNKAEAKAPKTKYFKPASTENSEFRLKLAKI